MLLRLTTDELGGVGPSGGLKVAHEGIDQELPLGNGEQSIGRRIVHHPNRLLSRDVPLRKKRIGRDLPLVESNDGSDLSTLTGVLNRQRQVAVGRRVPAR